MITTVSLNPSVDRTLEVENIRIGSLNRVVSARQDAGGKGINVALALSRLGLDSCCIGFMHRDNSRIFENKLLANSTSFDFIWCDGSVRTNIKLRDMSTGVITEINEAGEVIPEESLAKMTALVQNHAENSDFLILSGSVPPGCPKDYYRTLIESVEGLDCRCILDADGPRLEEGIKARPFMIKPNRMELEAMAGRPLTDVRTIRDTALAYIEMGIRVVAVSLGDDGAFITNGTESYYAPRMDIAPLSTVGAGDSMVAGLAAGFIGEKPLDECFRMGVACASAKCLTDGALVFEKSVYRSLLEKVVLESI